MSNEIDDEAEIYTFQWKIENISHCWWLKMAEEIQSPAFIADGLEGTKWSLSLYPMGYTDGKCVGIFLNRNEDSDRSNVIEVCYKLAFLDKEGSILKERTLRQSSFSEKETQGFPTFVDRETVFVTHRETFLSGDTLTVQCSIWNRCYGRFRFNPKYIYARTIFKVNRKSVEWKIGKISPSKSTYKKRYKQKLISFDIVFNAQEKKVILDEISFNDGLNYISCSVSILDPDGRKKNCGIKEYLPSDLRNGNLSFKLRSREMFEEIKSLYLPNDMLYLELIFLTVERISFEQNYVKFENETRVETDKSPDVTALIDNFKSMYHDNKNLNDIILRTPTQEFPAHKALLSARSTVFLRMFSTDMIENKAGYVEIADFKDDTVRRMLLYMYTDSLEDLVFENSVELYKIADKYDIQPLKCKCSFLLKKNLDNTNVCVVLILADQHNDADLKMAAQKHITTTQITQFFKLSEWRDFMKNHIHLAAEVMHKRICKE